MKRILQKHPLIIYLAGFLLGKSFILEYLSPFAVAFMAVMLSKRPNISTALAVITTIGAFFVNIQHGVYVGMSISFVMIMYSYLEKHDKQEISIVPYQVFAAVLISKLLVVYGLGELSSFSIVMALLESILALLLTVIYLQAVPIVFGKMTIRILKNDEIICAFILIASILMGTTNWVISGVHIDQILGSVAILIFAYAGGAGIGAALGVVIGLIMSLSNPLLLDHIAILAFSGLLAGMFREGKKLLAISGYLIGYMTLTMYMRTSAELLPVLMELFVAAFLFSIVPRTINKYVTGLIPGTAVNMWNQTEYKNKVKELVSHKIGRYGEMLEQLSETFAVSRKQNFGEVEFQQFIQHVALVSCKQCLRYNRCWKEDFYQSYKTFVDIFIRIESGEQVNMHELPHEFAARCIDKKRLITILEQEFKLFTKEHQWREQLLECKGLLSEQFRGVSHVINQLATEIASEGLEFSKQEIEISRAMEKLGLAVVHTQIINLDKGNIEIQVTKSGCQRHEECAKVLAPMITDIVGENVTINKKQNCNCNNGECTVLLTSAPLFDVEYGFVSIGKGGTYISGDSYEGVDLGNGKYVLAISDGMGNGQRAREESQTAIKLLKTLLQAGLSEDTAIKTINAALLLRSNEEIFATLDLAFINLFTGETKFMKVGSSPSFIKSNSSVDIITNKSLPAGILQDIQYSLDRKVLRVGSIIIMISDGILDSIRHINDKEAWLERIIAQIECDDPQSIADIIIEKVLRFNENVVVDDTTVLVAKINSYEPKWEKIPTLATNKLAIMDNY